MRTADLPSLIRPLRLWAAILLLAASGGGAAHAQTWTGATSTTWNSLGNWGIGGVPTGASATASFTATAVNTTVDLGAGAYTIGTLDFSATSVAYTFQNGASLTLSTISDASSNNQTINIAQLLLGAAGTFTNSGSGTLSLSSAINNNSFLLTFASTGATSASGVISGSGGLTKAGTGTLTLGNANTYTGTTTVTGGTLYLGNANAVQNSTVSIGSSGTLNINYLSANLGGLSGSGTITNNTSSFTVGSKNNTRDIFSGTVSGGGGLTKVGTGIQEISGTPGFGGNITINAGTLQADSAGSLGSGYISFGGSNATLDFSLTTAGSFGSSIGGMYTGDSLVKDGSGALTLTASQYFTGNVTVNAGSLIIGGGVNLQNDLVTINVNNGFDVTTNGVNTTIGALAGSGSLDLGSTTLTAGGTGATTTFSGALSGTSASELYVNGGALNLSAANSFHGTTYIGSGSVTLGNSAALQNSTIYIGATNGLKFGALSAATVGALTGSSDDSIGSTAITFTGTGTSLYQGILSGTGSLTENALGGEQKLGGSNTFTGATTITQGKIGTTSANALQYSAVTVNVNGGLDPDGQNPVLGSLAGTGSITGGGGTQFTVGGNNASTVYSGCISGAGTLTKVGTGTFELANTNSFSGYTGVTISAGTLQADKIGSIGATNVADNGALIFNLSSANSGTFSNMISGSGTLIKQGTGTLTLTLPAYQYNTYSGGTTISAGTVVAANNTPGTTYSTLGTGTVTIANGATLSVGEAVNTSTSPQAVSGYPLTATSIVGPATNPSTPLLTFNLGASGVGDTLALNAAAGLPDLTFSGSGFFVVGFASATGAAVAPGGVYHLLTFSNPGSATVAKPAGTRFLTYGTSTASAANDEFSAVAMGNLSSVNGNFAWVYDGSGNLAGLDYNTMPEPSALWLAGVGLGGVGVGGRRRKAC